MRQQSKKQVRAAIRDYWNSAGKIKQKKPAKPRFTLVKDDRKKPNE